MIAAAAKKADRPAPSPDGPNGRAPNGRFTSGNSFGRGQPYAKRVAQLKTQMIEAAEDRLGEVVAAMFDRAAGGDVAAADLVFRYSLGRPSPAIDPDALALRAAQLAADQVAAVLHTPKVTDLVRLADDHLPVEALVPVLKALLERTRRAHGKHDRDDVVAHIIANALTALEEADDGQ